MYMCHLTHDRYGILEHRLNLKNISYVTQFQYTLNEKFQHGLIHFKDSIEK